MADFTIRPTAKFIVIRLIATSVVFLAIEIWYFTSLRQTPEVRLFPYIAPVVFLPVLLRLFRRQLTTVTLQGDRLRYQTGFLSKTTRTVQISKLQDVRVDQRPMQRAFHVGDISIETAGETSRLTIADVDNPQGIADEILNRSQANPTTNR